MVSGRRPVSPTEGLGVPRARFLDQVELIQMRKEAGTGRNHEESTGELKTETHV